MKHQLEKHKPGECDVLGICQICDGGLEHCLVCGGAEASMPTDCPGSRMTMEQADAVQAGQIDFIENKGWVNK